MKVEVLIEGSKSKLIKYLLEKGKKEKGQRTGSVFGLMGTCNNTYKNLLIKDGIYCNYLKWLSLSLSLYIYIYIYIC